MVLKDNERVYPWGHSRRINTYVGHISQIFGERVQKLSINAGFTCPNRDGTLAQGGCSYCNNTSFNPGYCIPSKSIKDQLNEGIQFLSHRYRRVKKYLAYFQAYSNTYAPLEVLKERFEQALAVDKVVGLVIGTRPDCVDEAKLDYLATLSKSYYLSLEFGIEACDDSVLQSINRGHTYSQSIWAVEQAAKRGINVGGHFIIGLPGQTVKDTIRQVDTINQLPLTSIKFHQLQIVEGTRMAQEYYDRPADFALFSASEYLELMVDIVERLNPKFVVERVSGEASPQTLIAPKWGDLRADRLLVELEKLLEQRDTWQGKKVDSSI